MTLDARTKEKALTVLEATREIKGKDIIGLDLSIVESYTDFIIIASGGSDRQGRAVADNIIKRMFEKHHLHPLGTEGYAQADWILIDFGDIIAHVFFDESRRFYHIEDMWLQVTPIPDSKLEKFLTAKPKVARQTVVKKTAVKKAAVRQGKKSS